MADKPAHVAIAQDLDTLGWLLLNLACTIEHRGDDPAMAGRIREQGDSIAERVAATMGRWPAVALLG